MWNASRLSAASIAVLVGCASSPGIRSAQTLFSYDVKAPAVRELGVEARPGAAVHDVAFDGSAGREIRAYLVVPDGGPAPHAGILYVHWLGEEKSDRTEFLDEAVELAKKGAVSLLINTPWSAPKWFETRTCQADYGSSIEQVRDLRRALDVLVAQPGVDPARIGYVGHDFGAMYGVLMGAADPRPKAFVLIAGTTHFSDWFLLGAPPKEQDKAAYLRQMAELDPIRFVGELAPRPILFQFANKDPYVSRAVAHAFSSAAGEPKELHFYETTHRMDDAGAAAERVRWLSRALSLPDGP